MSIDTMLFIEVKLNLTSEFCCWLRLVTTVCVARGVLVLHIFDWRCRARCITFVRLVLKFGSHNGGLCQRGGSNERGSFTHFKRFMCR